MSERYNDPAIPHEAFLRIEKPTLGDYDDPVRRAVLIEQTKLEVRERAMVEVRELLAAGWKYELPDITDSEPWQWYWRSPPSVPIVAGVSIGVRRKRLMLYGEATQTRKRGARERA